MKNKKILISLVVFVALLCLGIGYAAVSKNLVIGGTGTTNNETGDASDDVLAKNFLVKFAGTYTTNVTNGDGAKINVSILVAISRSTPVFSITCNVSASVRKN